MLPRRHASLLHEWIPSDFPGAVPGLSMRQPRAEAFFATFSNGQPKKSIELLPWACRYRGYIVIHAAAAWEHQTPTQSSKEGFHNNMPFIERLDMARDPAAYPRGVLVGIAKLTKCARFRQQSYESLRAQHASMQPWSPDIIGWQFEDAQRFSEPIAFKGRRGFFAVHAAFLPSDLCALFQVVPPHYMYQPLSEASRKSSHTALMAALVANIEYDAYFAMLTRRIDLGRDIVVTWDGQRLLVNGQDPAIWTDAHKTVAEQQMLDDLHSLRIIPQHYIDEGVRRKLMDRVYQGEHIHADDGDRDKWNVWQDDAVFMRLHHTLEEFGLYPGQLVRFATQDPRSHKQLSGEGVIIDMASRGEKILIEWQGTRKTERIAVEFDEIECL